MERELLEENELSKALAELNGWRRDGAEIKMRREFANFAEALAFVNKVGAFAEEADHHPDITFGWGYAEVALTTHDRGGVTDSDVALAKKIDTL